MPIDYGQKRALQVKIDFPPAVPLTRPGEYTGVYGQPDLPSEPVRQDTPTAGEISQALTSLDKFAHMRAKTKKLDETQKAMVVEPFRVLQSAAIIKDWLRQGLCSETDPAVFNPPDLPEGIGGGVEHFFTGAAKKICRLCDVRPECLVAAVKKEKDEFATNREVGVWGGFSSGQRANIIDILKRNGVI